jgi:hypothetical protein
MTREVVKTAEVMAPKSLERDVEGSNFSGLADVDDALMYFRIGNTER